jgi:prepilin-type N-terminal cleavage/methylation domain-containing protein
MRRKTAGFTLIEILVVITIIAGLMGLVVAFIGKANRTRDNVITSTRIGGLQAALTGVANKQALAMYPSADLAKLRGPKGEKVGEMAGVPNDTNMGIETLYVAIHLATLSIRLDEKDEWFGNTDEDSMSSNPTSSTKLDLLEYVDAWGNPFAYFSAGEYKNFAPVSKYMMADGRTVVVEPHRSEKTGQALNRGTYQLFSAGPDLEFNTDDDIGNW